MSRIPSNTEQFLGGVAAGVQNVGQAAQNFQISSQRDIALQELAQRDRQMAQQGQQFERGLKAEEENYRRLNESRERMQAQELGQQGAQFNQRMEFDREQARLEQLLSVKMKNIEFEMAAADREIAASADNDPRLVEMRARRKTLRDEGRNLEQLVSAAGLASQMAGEVRSDRLSEITARLTAHSEALATRYANATDAVRSGFDYASLQNAGKESFVNQVRRLDALMRQELGNVGTAAANLAGVAPVTMLAMNNVAKWVLGASGGSEDLARLAATNFTKNGGAMAASIVENTFDVSGSAFGLKGPDQEKAKRLMGEIISTASIMRGVTPEMRTTGSDMNAQREKIAANIQELRSIGMGDEQIGGILDGLETLAENRAETLRMMDPTELGGPEQTMLQESLTGVGRIHDLIDGVASDKTLMAKYGGALSDQSKYDYAGTIRRAQQAYGLGESAEFQTLMQELDAMGVSPEQRAEYVRLLTDAAPGLENLRPDFFRSQAQALGRRQVAAGQEAENLDELLAQTQGQVVAGRQAQVYRGAQAGLEDLVRDIGG